MTLASGYAPDDAANLIKTFARETHGVMHAVLVAADGLAITASDGLHRDAVDTVAASASSLMAVAYSMARGFDAGEPEILTFRTPHMHFLFMEVLDRAGLAVLAEREANLGAVGHQMQRLVAAVGQRLQPDLRPPVPQSTASGHR